MLIRSQGVVGPWLGSPRLYVYVSVLVNDLQGLCAHLDQVGIGYFGPKPSHLGADSIHLTDPDGNHLEIHQDG